MFKVGDYIIYGNNGVCKVVEVGPIDLDGIDEEKIYYTLEPVFEKGSKVYIPVNNKKVLMRGTISKEEALKLIDDIPDIEFQIELDDKQREARIKEALKTHDCREWVKIIKELYLKQEERNSQGKKITTLDEKFLQTAEDCLYGELSVSMNMTKEDIKEFVVSRLNEKKLV